LRLPAELSLFLPAHKLPGAERIDAKD